MITKSELRMSNLLIPTANQAWMNSLQEVIDEGEKVNPRGIETHEIIGSSIRFDMNYPICYHQHRHLSYTFMAAEAYWITSGSMFVEDIAPYNKHIQKFSDDGYIFNGAYGPKFINQLDYVVNCLRKDSLSRQAVMTIWVPNPIETKDYACTLALQFLIRDNALHTIVTMRSNDLWLGRPYDMFNFTIMSLRVLTYLNSDNYIETFNAPIELGHLTLQVGSTHLYQNNWEKANQVADILPNISPNPVPIRAYYDWKFVVESLLACRDKDEDAIQKCSLWRIRP